MRFLCLVFLALLLFGLAAALWFVRHGPGQDFATKGGTILVYEVDTSKFPDGKMPDSFRPEQLVTALNRRLDPAGRANITVRWQNPNRVEIRIPRVGPNHAGQDRL
jgi:hypothetical protein